LGNEVIPQRAQIFAAVVFPIVTYGSKKKITGYYGRLDPVFDSYCIAMFLAIPSSGLLRYMLGTASVIPEQVSKNSCTCPEAGALKAFCQVNN
jgi:hypothetical protein